VLLFQVTPEPLVEQPPSLPPILIRRAAPCLGHLVERGLDLALGFLPVTGVLLIGELKGEGLSCAQPSVRKPLVHSLSPPEAFRSSQRARVPKLSLRPLRSPQELAASLPSAFL